MTDVNVVPTSAFNLLSVSKMLKQGWSLSGNKQGLTLSKNKARFTFDIVINTPQGVIFAMYLKRDSEVTGVAADVPVQKTLKQAHKQLGHSGTDSVRKTAKRLKWLIVGGKQQTWPCASCAMAKAKQKNIAYTHDEPREKQFDRGYLDLSSFKMPKNVLNLTRPH